MKGLVISLCAVACAAAQQIPAPVIYPGGAVNGAGFVPANQPQHALAPGSIASLFGENLASTTAYAQQLPLPTMLAGTSVSLNGLLVPLFYVSPGQINFQVPSSAPTFSADGYGQLSITAITAAGASNAIVADGIAYNPMAFTRSGTGCGLAAVLNVGSDGTISVNGPSNSVSPGQYIEIFGTGLGAVSNAPMDGYPAGASAPSKALGGGGASFAFGGWSGPASFAGRAPGLVGVDQINLQVPMGVQEGCAVPMQIGAGPAATVSIHTGGGQCVDPPIQSTASFTLKRSIALNDSTTPEADTFSASFTASPGLTLPPPVVLPIAIGNSAIIPTPYCPIPGYTTPDAGVITVSGPGLAPTQIAPTTANGVTTYQAALPAGSVGPGTYQVSAAGGNGIGAFQAPVTIGPGIQVTSQYPPGQVHGVSSFTVNWTGGQPGEAVTVNVVSPQLGYDELNYWEVTAPTESVTFNTPLFEWPSGVPTEVDVLVSPDPSKPLTFAAPGLTLGGQGNWVLQYSFLGLIF